jgi:hypothetical protein
MKNELYLGEDDRLQNAFDKHFKKEKEAVYNFLKPSDIHPDIEKFLDIDKMLQYFKENDEDGDFEITENYSFNVCTMCNNASAWAILQFKNNKSEILKELKVIEGNFGWMEHTWLIYKDKYYIDLTLAQFKREAPKIAVLEVNDEIKTDERQDFFHTNPKYREWGRETTEEWILHL